MKDLIKFLEEKIDKKINIYEYDEKLKDKYQEVKFDGKKYLIEIKEKEYQSIKGHTYILKCNENQKEAIDILKNLFLECSIYKKEDYIILVSDQKNIDTKKIIDILESEVYVSVKIVYIGYISDIDQLNIRLNVAKDIIKYTQRTNEKRGTFKLRDFIKYDILSSLENDKIKKYISYIFEEKDISLLDKETIKTALEFINCDLNIAKTSKKLYIHRNTLIYRLDKVKDILGLDLRKFEDAFYFYIGIFFWRK
ncbi:PucR C-terminal helix-turn-helix domain-containing protein [Alkalithermobacter thermoalcaliphilus JW-YL-7 = DSM 7308]|uniref:PucR C-terminal helix-turn-helix domain-containing protein n=1 Tax=Alkalithermobacter thermoalcaliphilus JW-YL-7 = DSM 7308 TaxID=1121328 RepID=A0A150FSP8_CLOPD|nr:putative transcriptional regulator, PucR family [[Clostridium] paradoxum JW-YL-7 = DSM 7308]SHL20385.1 PucR C-terminal helix-turn-helix domain-containing protein [[Clostridium] paradoxum JW-YL-7 = DSM 7308]